MIIGIPKEVKDSETRLGLTPPYVRSLTQQGHTVYFQKNCGLAGGMSNEEFLEAGGQMVDTMEEIYNKCEMIVKFKDLEPEDLAMPFRKGQMIFTAFHMGENTAKPEQVKRLQEAEVTCVSYEITRFADGTRALTRPMGEIAGRMAPLLGAQYLQRQYGGSGVCMMPITGAKRARVVIIGGGVAGLGAAETALGLGAEVVVFEKDLRRLEYLRSVIPNATLRIMEETSFAEEVARADVLINCIFAFPGMKVPVVTRDMVRSMAKGSVIVDIEGERIIETAQYTTISNPYFVEEGIVHVGITNIPAMVPAAANTTFPAAIYSIVEDTANYGLKEGAKRNFVLRSGIMMVEGKMTSPLVAKAQGVECVPLDDVL